MKSFKLKLKPRLLAAFVVVGSLVGNISSAFGEELIGNVDSGAQIYNAVCKGCHGVSIAPTLRGIIDRPIASTSFAGYSEGLKAKKDLTWSVENLNTFLIAPLDFAPGTLMVQAIPEAQKRADIIAFLAKLPPPRR